MEKLTEKVLKTESGTSQEVLLSLIKSIQDFEARLDLFELEIENKLLSVESYLEKLIQDNKDEINENQSMIEELTELQTDVNELTSKVTTLEDNIVDITLTGDY
jgi:chromosome segregation ATPase